MPPPRRSSSRGAESSLGSSSTVNKGKASKPSSSPPVKKKRMSLGMSSDQPKLDFGPAPQRPPAVTGQGASTHAAPAPPRPSSPNSTSPVSLGASLLNGIRARTSLGSTSPAAQPKSGRGSGGLMLPPDLKPPKLAPSDAKGKGKAIDLTEDEHSQAMWADLFMPKEREDLGVHKRKVQQVADWLQEALDGSPLTRKYRRMLALTGPVGSGKTAVLKALSAEKDLNFDIVEWSNEAGPQGALGGSFEAGNFTSLSQRFDDFLASAARYTKLELASTPGGAPARSGSSSLPPPSQGNAKRRQVILVEDLPNISHAPTKLAFISSLMAFLSRSASPSAPPLPLVLILSESFLRADDEGWAVSGRGVDWRDRASANTDAHNILGEEIRRHPAYFELRFNPVASTFLGKALRRVLELGRSKGSPLGESERQSLPTPTSSAAKALIELVVEEADGDLRSAVGTLQMACSAAGGSWNDAIGGAGSKRKKTKADPAEESRAKEEVKKRFDAATGREGSLMLFHTVGRVLYNKRYGDPGDTEKAPSVAASDATVEEWPIPPHLSHLERRQSKVDVDALWREMAVESSTLQLYLHQNYPLFVDDIEECAEIMERASFVEAELGGGSEGAWQHAALATQYAFLQNVNSLLLHLPSPVPRRNQRLAKPGFFSALRRSKEVVSAAEEARDGLRQELSTATFVESEAGSKEEPFMGQSSLLLGGGSKQMLHETLPLLAKVLQARQASSQASSSTAGVSRTTLEALRMATSMPWTGAGGAEDETLRETDGAEPSEDAAAASAFLGDNELVGSQEGATQLRAGTGKKIRLVKEEEDDERRRRKESESSVAATAEVLYDEDDDIEDF